MRHTLADQPLPLPQPTSWDARASASSASIRVASSTSTAAAAPVSSADSTWSPSRTDCPQDFSSALVLTARPLYASLCQLLSASSGAVSALLADLVSAVLADAARLGKSKADPGPALPPLSDAAFRVVEESRRAAHHAFVREEWACERELARLWELSCPGTPLDARVSKQWKTLGFQGTDPASDLRGPTGLVQLRLLVAVAERYPDLYASLQRNAARADIDFFPVAIASCNLSNVLFELLGFGMRPVASSVPGRVALAHVLTAEVSRAVSDSSSPGARRRRCLIDDTDIIEAPSCPPTASEAALQTLGSLQAMLLTMVQDEWLSTGATYMQFNAVLSAVRSRFERILVAAVAAHGADVVACTHLWAAVKPRVLTE